MKKLLLLAMAAGMMHSCNQTETKVEKRLITLHNEHIEVGILPDLGGRIVLLQKPGMKNVFESDTAFWNDPAARPVVSPYTKFKTFNGHIVWLSPQSEWWSKQDVNPERLKAKANWPPDPYLTYGDYRVLAQTDTSIMMVSPESPVSGMQLTKVLSFNEEGVVTFEVIGKNIREEPVNWGLWMNTRLDGSAHCFVPAGEENLKRLSVNAESPFEPMPHRFLNGYFTFLPKLPADSTSKSVQKAFLNPAKSFIAGFSEGQVLKIDFEPVEPDIIHQEQASVEIYNMMSVKERLLELEVHGPYTNLEPGETISLAETWQLFKYDGPSNPEDQIRFLNENIKDTD